MSTSLPGIARLEQTTEKLKQWQQRLNGAISIPSAPRPPFNLRAVGNGTQIILNWEAVLGADGYEVQSSANGDFSTVQTVSSLRGNALTTFTDASLTTGVTRWYRVRSTAGTDNNPQVSKGAWTAPVKTASNVTSIVYDQFTHVPGFITPVRRVF